MKKAVIFSDCESPVQPFSGDCGFTPLGSIEVIGGYLALQKSCLTKADSSRKKVSGGGRVTGREERGDGSHS